MQFKVPQFLEIEDKIFGPFTFKQFVYLMGGGGLCYVLLRLLGFWWGFIPMAAIAGLAAALAFYRPNNKPFIEMLEASAMYFMQGKLYIWKKDMINKKRDEKKSAVPTATGISVKLGNSKLRDLAWSLDVLDLKKQ